MDVHSSSHRIHPLLCFTIIIIVGRSLFPHLSPLLFLPSGQCHICIILVVRLPSYFVIPPFILSYFVIPPLELRDNDLTDFDICIMHMSSIIVHEHIHPSPYSLQASSWHVFSSYTLFCLHISLGSFCGCTRHLLVLADTCPVLI